MSAAALLADLRAQGVILEAVGDRLRFRPRTAVPPDVRAALVAHKGELLAVLRTPAPRILRTGAPGFKKAVSHLLGLRLAAFAETRACLEVWVTWLPVSLWFVPAGADADILATEGITRGRVWTAEELADLFALEPSRETARTVAHAKRAFDGELAAVRPVGPAPCLVCRARRLWRSRHGALTCARCHPPAHPALAAEWIEVLG